MAIGMAVTFGAVLLLYVGFLLWFIRRVYLAKYYLTVSPDDEVSPRYRLARSVRALLSFLHAFAFFAVVAWLPFWLALTASQLGNPEWGIDLDAYSGFRIDFDELPGVEVAGLRDPVISGKTSVMIDSSDRLGWLLFSSWNLVRSIVVLFVLLQLRNMFVTLGRGEAFTNDNAGRLNRIGVTVIAAYLASPVLQYVGWGAVIDKISFNTEGVALYPAFELNLIGILIGLAALVFAGVIREAVELKDEQRLTI